MAFLFADLIVLPILDIYRKYYGAKIAALLLLVFYASMAGAALVVEFLFGALHLVPHERKAQIVEEGIRWNYTTVLNIGFLAVALLLVVRFLRTGGPAMLQMMNRGKHDAGHSEPGRLVDCHEWWCMWLAPR